MNQIDLSGKTAVVTGAARGIGLAISERLLASGANCALWDNDAPALVAAEKKLGNPERVYAVAVDITAEPSVAAATEAVHARCDAIDILVNNAGIAGVSKKLWECSPA